jgi:hypothetical protein
MNPPLDCLIQSFEHIIQQLKTIEGIFDSTAEAHIQKASAKQPEARLSPMSLPDRLFQRDEDCSN